MKWTLLVAAVAMLAGAADAQPFPARRPAPTPAQIYVYTATTMQPVRQSGDVVVGAVRWRCAGNVCTASGPWPRPSTGACIGLARRVGRMRSYGHPGAMLDAEQLTLCNGGIMGGGVR